MTVRRGEPLDRETDAELRATMEALYDLAVRHPRPAVSAAEVQRMLSLNDAELQQWLADNPAPVRTGPNRFEPG